MTVLGKAFDTLSYENKPIDGPDHDIPVQNNILSRDITSNLEPMSEISLFDLMLSDTCRQFPYKKALLIDPGDSSKKITYGQFKERALKCAASLKREYGLQSGDVIAVCSPDSIEYAILFYGALAAGKMNNISIYKVCSKVYRLICRLRLLADASLGYIYS